MLQAESIARLETNVRLFPWYRAGADAMAWLPVFFLYFSERVALHQVVLLEAVYYTTIVILEVPSGYFSDRYGRRYTLLLGALALCASYLAFIVSGGFAGLLLAQFLLAFGMSLRSGTDTAMHYDTLAALQRSHEFAAREALAERAGLAALALASLVGGLCGWLDLRLAYALSLFGAMASFAIVLRFSEPGEHVADRALAEGNLLAQLRRCGGYLRLAPVLWLAGFFVTLDLLMHVPYEFYQPYLKLLEQDVLASGSSAPVSGVLLAVAMGLAAWAAGHSVALRERLGLPALLLGALAIQAGIVVVMASWLGLLTALAVCLRNVSDALTHAPFNEALGRHLSAAHRATFLSLLNLAGRIGLGLLLGGIAWWLAPAVTADWPTLRAILVFCAGLGLAALAVLALGAGALRGNRH